MADNTSKDTSLQSTKQMLDELDSLMERMLSLPVNEMDETPPPTASNQSVGMTASLTLLDTAESAPASKPAMNPSILKAKPTLRSSPTVSTIAPDAPSRPIERRPRAKLVHPPVKPPHLVMPGMKVPEVPHVPEVEPAAESPISLAPLTNQVTPSSVEPSLTLLLDESKLTSAVAPPARRRRFGMLLWINQRFDRSTMVLGGVGRSLRSPLGRTLLGFCGVALFMVGVGWMLKDWLGWNWQ